MMTAGHAGTWRIPVLLLWLSACNNTLAFERVGVAIDHDHFHVRGESVDSDAEEQAVEVDAEAEVEPAVSDAGTYTIDDEEEDPKDDPDLDQDGVHTGTNNAVTSESHRDKDIHRTFGVMSSEKVSCSRAEWVSVWASNTFAEDNPIQEEDDLAEAERSSSSQRRRLPPTPSRQNGYQHKDNHDEIEEDTNEYLRDTISLMTAMEARISSSTEETALQQREELRTADLANLAFPTMMLLADVAVACASWHYQVPAAGIEDDIENLGLGPTHGEFAIVGTLVVDDVTIAMEGNELPLQPHRQRPLPRRWRRRWQ